MSPVAAWSRTVPRVGLAASVLINHNIDVPPASSWAIRWSSSEEAAWLQGLVGEHPDSLQRQTGTGYVLGQPVVGRSTTTSAISPDLQLHDFEDWRQEVHEVWVNGPAKPPSQRDMSVYKG